MRCENCQIEHDGMYGSGRFCSRSCANKRIHSEDTKRKIRDSVTKHHTTVIECLQCKLRRVVPWNRRTDKFCSRTCAAQHRVSDPSYIATLNEIVKTSKKGHYNKNPKNIFEVSPQTSYKIIHRLNLSCFICSWNKAHCDLHHIKGRLVSDPNTHSNITYVCPNCHRLIHRGIIDIKNVKTFENVVGDSWKNFYYG